MKEFIKENKESFLEYIKFVEGKENEIQNLKEEIRSKKALVMSQNITTLEKPYEEIEKRKDRILKLDEELAKFGVGRDQNKINQPFKVKIEIDFDYEIEAKKIEKEKQKIQSEIDDIIEGCRNKLKFKNIQEEIKNIEAKIEEVKTEIESKKIDMLKLIQQKIDSKTEVVNNILERRKNTIPKLQSEIQEIKETLLSIKNRNFGEDADLKDIQNKTIQRLERQIEEKEIKLKDDKETFNSALTRNKEEINQLNQLKADIKEKDIKDIVYEALGYEIKEKNTENDIEEAGKVEEEVEVEEKEEENLTKGYKTIPEIYEGKWTENGVVWIKSEELEQKPKLTDRIINIVNKIKLRFKKDDKKEEITLDTEETERLDFSTRMSTNVTTKSIDMSQLENNNEIEKDDFIK